MVGDPVMVSKGAIAVSDEGMTMVSVVVVSNVAVRLPLSVRLL